MNIEKLIELVKLHPVLYESRGSNYRNRNQTKQLWTEIGVLLSSDAATVKKKWRNLKDCYRKYLKSTSALTTIASASRYRKWPWAGKMAFFAPYQSHTVRRRGKRAVSETAAAAATATVTATATATATAGQSGESSTPEESPSTSLCSSKIAISQANSNPAPSTPEKYVDSLAEQVEATPSGNCHGNSNATEQILLGYATIISKFTCERQAKIKMQIAQIIMENELEHDKEQRMRLFVPRTQIRF